MNFFFSFFFFFFLSLSQKAETYILDKCSVLSARLVYLDQETSCSSSWDVAPPVPLVNALESCSSTDTSKNQSMMTWLVLLLFSDSWKVALEKTTSSSATVMRMPVLDEQIWNPVVCCGKCLFFVLG